jgi:adenosylcobinamide-GDP ribazoletransferase
MIEQWRLFVAALRFVIRPVFGTDSIAPHAAARFVPLVGIVVGLIGAATYWFAAQLWPTNVAVLFSMLVTFAITGPRSTSSAVYWVFVLLIEYNVLMSLSSANVPFALPPYVPLGVILVAGQAASRAMAVSVMATRGPVAERAASVDLFVALIVGLAPAALLGIPGLVGLAAVIGLRLALGVWVLPHLLPGARGQLEVTQRITAIGFYLGALAAWNYS